MKKAGWGLMGCLTVAACAQAPAPVVSGYDTSTKPVLRRMAEREAPRLLEPAQPQQTIGGVPVMQVSKVEELPPPVQKFDVEPAAGPARAEATAPIAEPAAPQFVEHTVAGTDSIYKIASEYHTSARKVMETNGIADPAAIKVGQVLKIEVGAKQPTAWQEMQDMLAGKAENQPAAEQPVQVAANVPAKPMAAAEAKPVEVAETAPQPEAQQKWAMHKVEAKETIYRISKAYHVSVFDIMAANDFEKPQDLKYGTEVKIPLAQVQVAAKQDADLAKVEPAAGDGRENDRRLAMLDEKDLQRSQVSDAAEAVVAPVKAASSGLDVSQMEKKRGQIDPVASRAKGLVWPVKGEVVRKFGDGGAGVAFTGINIAVPAGTPVLASDAGKVLYADDGLKIYGKLVLIRHDNGMVSAYAHNGYLLVNKGDHVKKGQVIAMSGASGNVEKPQLHFELRQHASAIDPLRVLPKL